MSRKHFIALANELIALRREMKAADQLDARITPIEPGTRVDTLDAYVIPRLAAFCQSQSLRFDRKKWLAVFAEGETHD